MSDNNKSYRIRTTVGSDEEPVVHVKMDQTYDKFDILSLSLNQTNNYRELNSDYGVVVGRVLANGGFGIPNAKISVFIKYEDTADIEKRILYNYNSSRSKNMDGIRYNLLPNDSDDECYQVVGSFPTKRVVLDNNSWIDVFDKYYKYTTKTNNSGDYMIYGVPTGNQTIHIDIDLSDIGVLSQRPRDMIYKGSNINQFDSPNKFKKDTNLDYLAQIITQDKVLYVYPFWGDTTDNELGAAITRCDIDVDYRFEPTCVFMGSIITDTGEDSLSKKCVGAKEQGKMSKMITGNGIIEMIRKTGDGLVESFSVKGNRLIDGDGVWCYQIPMNLDYVVTDEYGNTVLSDDPNKGIATRARVRFRISMSDTGEEGTARARARYLVPNNPRFVEEDYPNFVETNEVDYEFGSKTKDENFRDLFWNKVYTVKNYIPRLQKSKQPNNKRRTGIKMVNHSGSNNPMPFNSLGIRFNFTYLFLCAILKVFVLVVYGINTILTSIAYVLNRIGESFLRIYNKVKKFEDDLAVDWFDGFLHAIEQPFYDIGCWFEDIAYNSIGNGITLSGLCVDDEGNAKDYNPGVINGWRGPWQSICGYYKKPANTNVSELFNCVENQLAQENEITSFNFDNDWINGVLYMPLWYRKIKPKKKIFFGLFTRSAKDQWCNADKVITTGNKKHIKVYRTCSQQITVNNGSSTTMGSLKPLSENEYIRNAIQLDKIGIETIDFRQENDDNCYGFNCHNKARTFVPIDRGLIVKKETMLGDEVYYYRPIEYNTKYNSDLVTLFATDLVLLGSMDSCDLNGIPQFFTALESTTYNMPPDLLIEDYEYNAGDNNYDDNNDSASINKSTRMTENTGADWGNTGYDQSSNSNANENVYDNGGLFYGLTCFNSYTKPKSCVNLTRICEFGVGLDESQDIMNVERVNDTIFNDDNAFETIHDTLIPDGFVSYDEIYSMDYRSMFATLNGNWLKTKLNYKTGLYEYDFNHLYIENFDGLLKNIMNGTSVHGKTNKSDFQTSANYINNYKLEASSNDYLAFRYGNYKKKNGKKIYYYDYNTLVRLNVYSKDRFPRYENSFYFYFGLNEGKTAIDKFRTEMFVECSNDKSLGNPYSIAINPNDWCVDDDSDDGWGTIFFATNIQTPITVRLTKINSDQTLIYEANNIKKQNFCIGAVNDTSQIYNGIQASKYEHYDLTLTVDGGGPTTGVSHIKTGDYDIEIIDGDDNITTDRISFKGAPVTYECDSYSFAIKNSELETMFNYQYKNDGDVVNWQKVFSDIAEKDKNVLSGQYTLDERSIKGIITVSNISAQYFKIDITPVSHDYFGYDWVGVIETETETENDRYQLLTPEQKDEIEDDVYRYVLAYTTTVDNDASQVNVAYFKGDVENPPASTEEYEAQYRDGSIRCDVSNWQIIDNSFDSIEYVDNYPGCSVLGHYNDPEAFDSVIIDSVTGVGYLGYNGSTLFFGAPYGGQRYNVTVTYMCNINGTMSDASNVVTNTVAVMEPHFKMYLNGIDYDIIKNFKTGFDFTDTSIQDIDTNYTNASTIDSPTFSTNNIYGWNTVDNIGKVKISSGGQSGYSVMEPIDYNNTLSDNNLADITKKYLETLSVDYEGNGRKIYNNAFEFNRIDIDVVAPILGRDSLFSGPINGGSNSHPLYTNVSNSNLNDTQRIIREEYGNPYCWTDDYCYSSIDYTNDMNTAKYANNTIERTIEYTPTDLESKNSSFDFFDTVDVSINGNIITDSSINFSFPYTEEGVSYTMDMTFSELDSVNDKITMDFRDSDDNGITKVVGVIKEEITEEIETDSGTEMVPYYYYYYDNSNDNLVRFPILVAVQRIRGDRTPDPDNIDYIDYRDVNVSYNNLITRHQKLVEVCQRINEIVLKRIDFANQVKNAFRTTNDITSLEITYESNETPIRYKCVGSEEANIQNNDN